MKNKIILPVSVANRSFKKKPPAIEEGMVSRKNETVIEITILLIVLFLSRPCSLEVTCVLDLTVRTMRSILQTSRILNGMIEYA